MLFNVSEIILKGGRILLNYVIKFQSYITKHWNSKQNSKLSIQFIKLKYLFKKKCLSEFPSKRKQKYY